MIVLLDSIQDVQMLAHQIWFSSFSTGHLVPNVWQHMTLRSKIFQNAIKKKTDLSHSTSLQTGPYMFAVSVFFHMFIWSCPVLFIVFIQCYIFSLFLQLWDFFEKEQRDFVWEFLRFLMVKKWLTRNHIQLSPLSRSQRDSLRNKNKSTLYICRCVFCFELFSSVLLFGSSLAPCMLVGMWFLFCSSVFSYFSTGLCFFFPACQVRVVRFYQSCCPPPPPHPPPPPPVSPQPCLHQLPPPLPPCQLFAKLFANFRAQCALLDLNLGPSQLSAQRWASTWGLPSSVRTAGPQPGAFPAQCAPLGLNLGPSQLSACRWTSTWDLPSSVHRWTSTWDLPSSVRTAGPQPGTFPAQCAPLDLNLGPSELSAHRWTSTAR